jgi:hypothetical protein
MVIFVVFTTTARSDPPFAPAAVSIGWILSEAEGESLQSALQYFSTSFKRGFERTNKATYDGMRRVPARCSGVVQRLLW